MLSSVLNRDCYSGFRNEKTTAPKDHPSHSNYARKPRPERGLGGSAAAGDRPQTGGLQGAERRLGVTVQDRLHGPSSAGRGNEFWSSYDL